MPLQIDLKKLEEGLAGAVVRDVHVETAMEMFACQPNEVTLEMRRRAKCWNFIRIYGGKCDRVRKLVS